MKTNARIERLFADTKLVCFGRYVLTVPKDSRLSFGYDIPTLPNQAENLRKIVDAKVAEIKAKDDTAEINYVGVGPAPHVAWIRSYKSDIAKDLGLEGFDIYYVLPPHIFVTGDAVSPEERTFEEVKANTLNTAYNLRLRATDEIPTDDGLCNEYAFQRCPGDEASMGAAGVHMAALPDVVFSVFSNTHASTDGDNGYGLLKLMENQRSKLDFWYPKNTVLRADKRKVHDWDGEETLFRNQDGSHHFRWMLVDKRRSVAYPAWLDVTMYEKVKYDQVGAAAHASLTDDEALALWDKLLESLKFRVAVPGAPDEAVQLKGGK
ncbi:hypothetical protein AAKU67_004209 [Oxalobacteraceae bacterium GrIS 2.11]